MSTPEVARIRRVLPILAWAERRTGVPSGLRPRRFDVLGSVARRRGSLDERLPGVVTRRVDDPPLGTVAGISTAQVVRVGKFDVAGIPRALAFYGGDRPASVRIQEADDGGGPGVAQAVAARRLVAQHAPQLAPPVFDDGLIARGRVAFLTEGLVAGQHPFTPEQLEPALDHLLGQLHQLHRGVGVQRTRLSLSMQALPRRWQAFADAWGLAAELRHAVAALIARDHHVDISLSHGDLVASNIVVDGEQAVLVDWEHARVRPIASDLAKLERLAHDPAAPARGYAALAGQGARSGTYALAEQVALAHVQLLGWYPARRDKAEAAGRLEALDADSRWRVERVHDLLVAG